jgi:serine/threonine-protein kinase
LGQLVGSGGIGRVWLARDDHLGRDVALKELRPEVAESAAHRARFLEEARITGQLEHPGIVPVYELVARADGPAFYVMRFVRGRTLADAVRGYHQRRRTGEAGPMELRELLDAFIAVCNAVAYAHSRCVLHRDLKPQNVILGDFGEVSVLDWGLAKLTDGEGEGTGLPPVSLPREPPRAQTQTGKILGTPAYVSPEQAEGRSDRMGIRSDVYGLGAVLYEVLTGEPPVGGRTIEEILQKIAQEQPVRPRQRVAATPLALEAVCLKALAKRAEDRYGSAKELAEEVQRWLADEPVRAYREPWRVRVARWVRRHQAATAAGAAAFLVVILLASGAWLWLEQERVERERQAEWELEQAAWLRAEAERAPAEQRHSLRADALAATERAGGLLAQGRASELIRQRVSDLVEELREEERDRRLLARLQDARLSGSAVNVKDERFDKTAMDREYRRAFGEFDTDLAGLVERASGRSSRGQTFPVELAAALDDWAEVVTDPGERERLHDLARLADPDEERGRLRDALAAKDVDALKRLATPEVVASLPPTTAVSLARGLKWRGASKEAEAVLRQTWRQAPSDFWVNQELGELLLALGRPEESVRFLTAAVALSGESLASRANLGVALLKAARVEEAIAQFRKVLTLKPDFAHAHSVFGNALLANHRPREAVAEYQRAIALRPDLVVAHFGLSRALDSLGRIDEAIAALRQAIVLGPPYAEIHNNLGLFLRDKNLMDEAIAEYQKAIALKRNFAEPHYNLGNALRDKGRLDEAIAEWRKTVALDPKFAEAHFNLGLALRQKDLLDEAIAAYRKAIEHKPDFAKAYHNLGNALFNKGRLDEAIAAYRAAIARQADFAEAHCLLGLALQERGQFRSAQEAIRRGHKLGSQRPGWPIPSAQWLREVERLVELDAKLPAVLRGRVKPAGAGEMAEFADLCQKYKKRYRAAARLWREAFAAQPGLASDSKAAYRYRAACAACQAGCGQGADVAYFDDAEKAGLRGHALEWLRADLVLRAKQLQGNKPSDRVEAAKALRSWQDDPDLAGVREEGLSQLPDAEGKQWRKLWSEVQALLSKIKK